MAMSKTTSEETERKILKLLQGGYKQKFIASRFGLSPGTIFNLKEQFKKEGKL